MSLLTSLVSSLNGGSAGQVDAQKAGPATEAESGPVADLGPTVTPRYHVTETAEAYGLTVELPGVAKDGLEVSLDGESVRIVGRRAWSKPDGWSARHRETLEANFVLVLEHGREIDPENIQAELRDGQLRISLSKAGSLKPRRIAVA